MSHSVFNECQQRERRHDARLCAGRDVEVNAETIAEPQSLDVQIPFDERALLGERDKIAFMLEHVAQQITELLRRLRGKLRLSWNELHDGVQRIEQKVWMQLRA